MKRITIKPRSNWVNLVEEHGLIFHHHPNGAVYWDESAYYKFTMDEVDEVETATSDLYELCLEAVEYVIRKRDYGGYRFPQAIIPLIEHSWKNSEPSIYGRFDLIFDGSKSPKLLEFNADTPTALLEASVIQWFWLKDVFPRKDQFNSIHEKLVARWKQLRSQLLNATHFACSQDETGEDIMTTAYLGDTALEAGLTSKYIFMDQIGWDSKKREFVIMENTPIEACFKLYPWEWMFQEPFGKYLIETYHKSKWIEPVWKILLSNKHILTILWKLFPRNEYLLECHTGSCGHLNKFVRKPLSGREGYDVTINELSRSTMPNSEDYVYQEFVPIKPFDDKYPIIGSWIIGDEAAGIGIREGSSMITNTESTFVPHIID